MPYIQSVDHLNNVFKSKKDMCKYWGVTVKQFDSRISKGLSLSEALNSQFAAESQFACYDHRGNKFKNKQEMCKQYGISISYLNRALREGKTLEDILGNIKVIQDPYGNIFRTYADMAKYHGFDPANFRSAVRSGYSLEEIFESGGHSPGVGKVSKDHRGITYKSKAEMCKAYGINAITFHARIRNGWDLARALETPERVNNSECYDHNGVKYNSIVDMCNHYGITYSMYSNRLRLNWPLEKVLTSPKSDDIIIKKDISVLGKHFNSFRDACEHFNIPASTVSNRLKEGNRNELDVSFVIPLECMRKIRIEFIGIDRKAYYKVPWSDKPVTARQIVEYYRPDLIDAYDKSNPTGEYRPYKGENKNG